MTHLRILGIDPGKCTGLALITESGFRAWQVTDRIVPAILEVIRENVPCHIACERFVHGMRSVRNTSQNSAAIVVNALSVQCEALGIPFERQAAGEAKLLSNNLLQRVGLYTVHKEHANDAAKHALFYLLKHYPTEYHNMITTGHLYPEESNDPKESNA